MKEKEPLEVIGVRIDPTLKKKIRRAAEVDERTPGDVARKMLEAGWSVYVASLSPEKRRKVAA